MSGLGSRSPPCGFVSPMWPWLASGPQLQPQSPFLSSSCTRVHCAPCPAHAAILLLPWGTPSLTPVTAALVPMQPVLCDIILSFYFLNGLSLPAPTPVPQEQGH